MAEFRLEIKRTATERSDSREYKGFAARDDGEASLQYHKEKQKRAKEIAQRIHTESGPIANCDCQICENYRKTETTGPEHTLTGCDCRVCEKNRRKIAKEKGVKYHSRSRRKMGREKENEINFVRWYNRINSR